MRFATDSPVRITVLGTGGTGGHLAPNLYRLAHSLDRPVVLTLVDGDLVERKNLVRQNFTQSDVGKNKARALAERYSSAFGMEAHYVPEYVECAQKLAELTTPPKYTDFDRRGVPVKKDGLPILLGCVDNNKSRRVCHEVFTGAGNMVYIDSGNGFLGGQVVCGVRRGSRTLSKPAAALYPEMLDDTDRFPSELSCAEAADSSPQSIAANITAAATIMSFLYNILVAGSLETCAATFSTRKIATRPTAAKPCRGKN